MQATPTPPDSPRAPAVDVVVVSYNSSDVLRACVEPLGGIEEVHVVVVDNASSDGSLKTIDDLPVETTQLRVNRGFAAGCNAGWTCGDAPYVLFLNPDARITVGAVHELIDAIETERAAGAVAPRIVDAGGATDYSLRRFPRLRSTFAQALFLHRLLPHASWVDEVIRAPDAYEEPRSVEWVSGACLLVRRDVLMELDGWDDGFFMYCEDIDLCRRVHGLGLEVRYVPTATVVHDGGASAPRAALLPVLAASRVRYASKHRSAGYTLLERAGIALGSLTHLLAGRGDRRMRAGHARALGVAAGFSKATRP
jgi:N-acetylglucosaminyl-diphospho-decaprenol L-rhamnosyltransferase